MLYPSINEIKKKVDSRYTLCILAAKRARDLIDGKPPLTQDAPCERPVSIAAQEISEDLITAKAHVDEPEEEPAEAEAAETAEAEPAEAGEVPAEEAPAEEAAPEE